MLGSGSRLYPSLLTKHKVISDPQIPVPAYTTCRFRQDRLCRGEVVAPWKVLVYRVIRTGQLSATTTDLNRGIGEFGLRIACHYACIYRCLWFRSDFFLMRHPRDPRSIGSEIGAAWRSWTPESWQVRLEGNRHKRLAGPAVPTPLAETGSAAGNEAAVAGADPGGKALTLAGRPPDLSVDRAGTQCRHRQGELDGSAVTAG